MRSGKNSKLRGTWMMVVALGWSAAIALAACAVDPAPDPAPDSAMDPALDNTSETRQEGRFDPEPPWDTICGDGLCSGREDLFNCPEDCSPPPDICGNGICGFNETYFNCPADCPYPVTCGDNLCSPGESCPIDCAPVTCGDCICHPGETTSCPWDCNLPNYPTWCIEP